MSKEEIKKIDLLKGKIIGPDGARMDVVNEIVLLLRRTKEVDDFRDSYFEIKRILFDNDISSPGINSLESKYDIEKGKQKLKATITKSKQASVSIKNNFLEHLKKVTKSIYLIYPNLKNCFFINLSNQQNDDYKLVLLYDKDCFLQHLKEAIETEFDKKEYFQFEYSDFKDKLTNGEFQSENLLCVMMISPKVSKDKLQKQIIPDIREIIDFFQQKEHVSILGNDFKSDWCRRSNDIEELMEEINCVGSITLTNSEISNDEEKIIKKFFERSNVELLEYKLIRKGYSGSTVIEVSPRKSFGNTGAKKYILKINRNGGKIREEIQNFNNFIEDFHLQANNYIKVDKSNHTHEGIKYIYAAPSNNIETISFGELLNKYKDNVKITLIDDLFSKVPLFKTWDQSKEDFTGKISEIYMSENSEFGKVFLKKDDLTFWIKKIKGYNSESELNRDVLFKNFELICQKSISTYKKVCHGDLHSENIFVSKDYKDIYLIDFGLTKYYQACMDHVLLECSIKFNHIPRYITVNDLEQIEKELINSASFTSRFQYTTIKRSELEKYFSLIHALRVNSTYNYISDTVNYVDYFLALFFASCRQMCFKDLNQLYAYNSAKALSEYLVTELN